ncbi:hypothetical protein [Ruania zhangjianzhongii]|uniref:hypothetical protein n=1 Tax=Ruania zhangjianzhongii TaxID=2603206 RepID=UPI0011CC0D6A|nr:hypothetical protein [Ruania zhangjianzhongii]
MTEAAGRWRWTRRKVVLAGALVLVAVVVGVLVLVLGDSAACGCSIPESDESAIETAQEYVAGVAEDPEAMLASGAEAPSAEQVERLSLLDQPGTHWVVHLAEHPEGGGGDSPAERLIVGVAPGGEFAALVVHTESDHLSGTVDPEVELAETDPVIARSGEYPIFGDLQVGMSDDARGHLTLISPADGELELSVTGSGGAWAYVGDEPLTDEQYLYVRGGHFDDGWRLFTGWFSPSDPVRQDA